MTRNPRSGGPASNGLVIPPLQARHGDEHLVPVSQTSSSSSSSSSPSGIVTPVDDHPGVISVAFPRIPLTRNASSSSESGHGYAFGPRHRVQSFSKASILSTASRPRTLSIDCTKSCIVPATPSALEEQASFRSPSQAHSAEGQLRSVLGRSNTSHALSPTSESESDATSASTFAGSLRRHTRSLSLRSLPFAWMKRSDIVVETEKDDAIQQPPKPTFSRRPSLNRDGASRRAGLNSTDSNLVPSLRTQYAHSRAASSPSPLTLSKSPEAQKPRPQRSNTFSGTPAQPRAVATLRFPESGRPVPVPQSTSTGSSRVFLKPKSSGKSSIHAAAIQNARAAARPTSQSSGVDTNTLDPTLAAAENASRFRAKCVCGVCGKMGVDYPRCPRCPATWCSRDCRTSPAPAGAKRHICAHKTQ